MNNLIFNILSKDLTYKTTPSYAGVIPPVTFASPIDVGMSWSVSYSESSGSRKQYLINYSISAKASGYGTNSQYPNFTIENGSNNNLFSWNLSIFSGLSDISGSYDLYENGNLTTHVDITSSNYNTYNSLARNPSMFEGFTLNIAYCSIPIIYRNAVDTYYGRSEWDLISISGGYDITRTLNMKEAEEMIYEFSTIARNYTMDSFGNLTENEAEGERYRGFRIKINGRVSLYKISGISDGMLKYKINMSGTPTICYYSTDYGNTWLNVPGQPTTLPFDYTYRTWEEDDGEGTFWAAIGDPNNEDLLMFDNKDDSDEYNSGESDGRKASNYNQIINGDFDNPTGEEDEETEFGEVKTRGFFSQQYIMDSTCLAALANDLFDTSTSFWEEISKGLRMYGDNPIEAVMGLSFWPLDLTSVFTGVSAPYVWFGGYGWEPSAGTALRLMYPNGYKTLGSIAIKRTFRNWRDYAPYTRLYVSLPYVGVYELDLTRYYDKTVEVRYYFDTRTNGCIACLIADGHLMDYFNGQMGVTMPITLTDYAGYANSQIATLLGAGALAAVAATGVGAAVAGAGSAALGLAGTAVGASGLAGAAAAAGAAGAAGGAVGIGLGGAAVAGTALGAKTAYGLSQNNINKHNVTKGGSSSMINEYLPQYVEFIFEIQEDCAPDNYGQQYGYPSMKSGSVGSFQGFLKCQSVKLDCGVATENEKNQIKTMLLNGIYI